MKNTTIIYIENSSPGNKYKRNVLKMKLLGKAKYKITVTVVVYAICCKQIEL